MEKFAVVMAGGAGSRLWPLSRENNPKQFISPDGNKSMLVQTINRICKVISPQNCYIVTNINLLEKTQDAIKNIIPVTNIITEPVRKNTAACISYATLFLKKKLGSGILSFIPADGYVKDNNNYIKALELAYSAAESTKHLIIVGINPTYPATGYGYIHANLTDNIENYSKVIQFVEKPDLETAKNFIMSGDYLWNSGIVLGDMDSIIDNIKLYLPNHYSMLSDAVNKIASDNYNDYIKNAYNGIESISFDIGVLEKSNYIYTVKGFFDWDDIGSLDALSKTLDKDSAGNSVRGNHFGIESSNSVIYGDDVLIATIGINNLIIASTKDAIIVCQRDRAQDIKSLVDMLKLNGYENLI